MQGSHDNDISPNDFQLILRSCFNSIGSNVCDFRLIRRLNVSRSHSCRSLVECLQFNDLWINRNSLNITILSQFSVNSGISHNYLWTYDGLIEYHLISSIKCLALLFITFMIIASLWHFLKVIYKLFSISTQKTRFNDLSQKILLIKNFTLNQIIYFYEKFTSSHRNYLRIVKMLTMRMLQLWKVIKIVDEIIFLRNSSDKVDVGLTRIQRAIFMNEDYWFLNSCYEFHTWKPFKILFESVVNNCQSHLAFLTLTTNML